MTPERKITSIWQRLKSFRPRTILRWFFKPTGGHNRLGIIGRAWLFGGFLSIVGLTLSIYDDSLGAPWIILAIIGVYSTLIITAFALLSFFRFRSWVWLSLAILVPASAAVWVRSEIGTSFKLLHQHPAAVSALMVSPTGYFIASGDHEGNIFWRNRWSSRMHHLVNVGASVQTLLIDARGTYTWAQDSDLSSVISADASGAFRRIPLTKTDRKGKKRPTNFTILNEVHRLRNPRISDNAAGILFAFNTADGKGHLVWGPARKVKEAQLQFSSAITALTRLLAHQSYFLFGLADGRVLIADFSNGTSPRIIKPPANAPKHKGRVSEVIDAFGNAASFSTDGSIIIWEFTPKSAGAKERPPPDLNAGQMFEPAPSIKKALVLRGHSGLIRDFAFSPDGKLIITASADKTARLWSAQTGRMQKVLKGHSGNVVSATFSFDSKSVVTTSVDGTARIWDIESGKKIATLQGKAKIVWRASFSPDSNLVLTQSSDGTARIWDAKTGSEIGVIEGHGDKITSAGFSPDGRLILTASDDKTARLWSAAGLQQVGVFSGHEAAVKSATFSFDGKRIITSSRDRTARIWDAATHQELFVLKRHSGPVTSASFSPDGSRVVTSSINDVTALWDAKTGKLLRAISLWRGPVLGATFSANSKYIAITYLSGRSRILDAASGLQIVDLIEKTNSTVRAIFSTDGTKLLTNSSNNSISVWSLKKSPPCPGCRHVSFASAKSRMLTIDNNSTARVWELHKRTPLGPPIIHGGVITSAAINSKGRRVFTGGADGLVKVWDTRTGALLASYRGHRDQITHMLIKRNKLYTAGLDGQVRVLNLRSVDSLRSNRYFDPEFVYAAYLRSAISAARTWFARQ